MTLQKNHQNFLINSIVLTFIFLSSSAAIAEKSIYGYLEPVTLAPDKVTLTAKLDTGAESASISAKEIQRYEKDGTEYVRFKVSHPEMEQTLDYDLPIVRHVRIKKRATGSIKTKKSHSRPVVNMQIYFDGKPHEIMVNLIDRSHFSTPMLLGRKALEKVGAIVDSTVENTLATENDNV
ncbi:MAG: ATP-dependent zinc protease [Burkholderiales bacterium]|nr:ATP-dependent zinc protease [Burkholderiales bacterium]MDR4518252.1 RimK/LysX family protein [Nitrosomonas sp.]